MLIFLFLKVLEEAGADSKPKYFHELLVLLQTVVHCPQLTGKTTPASTTVTAPVELCDALKQSLVAFRSKGLTKQKDLRKTYGALCRSLGVESGTVAPASKPANKPAQEPKKEANGEEKEPTPESAETKESKVNGLKKKVKRGKHAGQLEKKEAKKRRMEASAEGFAAVSFLTVHLDVLDDADDTNDAAPVVRDDEPGPKKTPKKKTLGEVNRANEAKLVESTPGKQKKQPGNVLIDIK